MSRFLAWHKCPYHGLVWFRIFGFGLLIKNLRKEEMLFSERNGHQSYMVIFHRLIRPLVPRGI